MENLNMYIEEFKVKYDAFLIGCDSIEELGMWDKEEFGEMDAFYLNDLSSVVIRLIAADGKITQKEVDYLNATFEFDYNLEDVINIYHNSGDEIEHSFDENFENGITCLRKINEKLADAYKALLSLVCEIIIKSDGIVTESELAQVHRLKALCE